MPFSAIANLSSVTRETPVPNAKVALRLIPRTPNRQNSPRGGTVDSLRPRVFTGQRCGTRLWCNPLGYREFTRRCFLELRALVNPEGMMRAALEWSAALIVGVRCVSVGH